MLIDKNYIFFWGTDIFSNFSAHPIDRFDMHFPTAEHYFQWRKALYFGDIATAAKITRAATPNAAKKLGRKVMFFSSSQWDLVKSDIMLDTLRNKVFCNPDVREELIAQGKNRKFAEASPFDRIWGIGFAEEVALKNKSVWGENILGKCWDAVYKEVVGKVESNLNKGQYELSFD